MPRQKRAELARKHFEKRLCLIRETNLLRPADGCIRAIREALVLTTRQLAQRMKASQSWGSELEKSRG